MTHWRPRPNWGTHWGPILSLVVMQLAVALCITGESGAGHWTKPYNGTHAASYSIDVARCDRSSPPVFYDAKKVRSVPRRPTGLGGLPARTTTVNGVYNGESMVSQWCIGCIHDVWWRVLMTLLMVYTRGDVYSRYTSIEACHSVVRGSMWEGRAWRVS
jgi:hypothetical protein